MSIRKLQLLQKQRDAYASLTQEQLDIIENYFSDGMKELKKICDPLISRKRVPEMYYEDLYAAASDTLIESLTGFDAAKKCSFQTFLTGNINRAFYDWTRDSTRLCRCNIQTDRDGKIVRDENGNAAIIPDIPLDAPTQDGLNLSDRVASNFRIEEELSLESGFRSGENLQRYMDSLSQTQKEIAQLILCGYEHSEIKEKLNISEKKYRRILNGMNTLEQKIMLNNCHDIKYEEDKKMNCTQVTQTAERSKPMQYSIASIIKKMESKTIRFDHPLQRESEQWSPSMKGNLISDILQGNPLPEIVFAEQIINGIPIVWDLDGKQRCTNCDSFFRDGFKISKNIRRWKIEYIAQVKNDDGTIAVDENNFPVSEYKTFDIRNKKMSQLPIELQEKFMDYTFKCDQYLNCSGEDIAYHMIRYNEGKNMNKAQKGITRIGEEFAAMVKSISAMPFFREKGGYRMSDTKNGTLERVVVESIMASNFVEDWKKDQEDICEFLRENASEEIFDRFEDMVDRLDAVITEETAEMFTAKDSFLWFGLFARFTHTGKPDVKFIEFLTEFVRSLHNRDAGGITYDGLCTDENTGKVRATKDKYIVTAKMKVLEKLMLDFLNIDSEEFECKENVTGESVLEFVQANVSEKIYMEDIELYRISMEDYTVEISECKKRQVDRNIKSYIALIAFAFSKEVDQVIPEWLVDYTNRNSTYKQDPKDNYLHMKKDLEEYLHRKGSAA